MAYDSATSQLLLFEGWTTGGDIGTTWAWNSTTSSWTEVATTGPAARNGASMVYDPATSQLILFGGENGSTQYNDTWKWTGSAWTQLSPAASPSVRFLAAAAYNPATGQVVLFGGYNYPSSSYLHDTWTWNGTTWTQQSPVTSPVVRQGPSMAYDSATGEMVLFGGNNGGTYYNDTWYWTGSTWVQVSAASDPGCTTACTASPPGRTIESMAYDAASSQLLVFGGQTSGGALAGDTWLIGAPTVTALSPSSGPVAGATTVVITGTGFTGAPATGAVMFGSSPATSYTVNSATQITATSPAGALGTVDVTVTTPDGASATSALDQFTYQAAPTISAVSPLGGLPVGGTAVTITGTNFTGATAIKFGAVSAPNPIVVSSTTVVVLSPAGTAGVVDVTATTSSGTSATSAADQFTYESPPSLTGISPSTGTPSGGTSVTITGTGFTGASGVKFGSVTAGSYTVSSSTQITTVSPAQSASTVHVTVTTPSGTSATSAADRFTYGARISGTVTDLANPTGLAGVCVSVKSSTGSGQTTTAADGTYSISGLPAGSYIVEFDPSCSGTVFTSDLTQWYNDAPTQADADPVTVTGGQTASGISALLFSTAGTLPGAPTNVAAIWGNASAIVTWSDPQNNGSAIVSYTVIATDSTNPANGGQSCTVDGSRATSCNVTGLKNGDNYTFAVAATNGVGTGPSSSTSNVIMPMTVPGAPTNVSATRSMVRTSAGITWLAPASTGGSPITGYIVKASGGGGQACRTTGAIYCTVTGLVNGASYTFSVVATNILGPGPASLASNQLLTGRWTQVAFTLSSTTAVYGNEQADSLSVKAYVQFAKNMPTPTGTVSITLFSKTICKLTLRAGKASCRLSPRELALGIYHLVATYSGNGIYLGSSKAKKLVIVKTRPTVSKLHLSHSKVSFGHEQLVRISVVTLSLRTGTPSGNVTIKEGSKLICTIKLINDIGSCRLSSRQLGVGIHTLVASYPGNPMYLSSVTSAKLTVVA